VPGTLTLLVLVVTPLDDAIREVTETVIAVLRKDAAYSVMTTSSQIVTITDNDPTAPVGVGFAASASNGLESKTPALLQVSRQILDLLFESIFVAFMLFLDFLDVFGRVFLEILEAGFAA